MGIKQPRSRAVQLVIAAGVVAETVGLVQEAVPGMPTFAILVLHLEVDGDFADVVEQGTVGNGGAPGIGLRGLVFRCSATREEVGLA
ncbi:hypothetical protein D3C84_855220 [compost metagenome]